MDRPHVEARFEEGIEAALLASGWLAGLPYNYDAELGLDTSEVTAFIGKTQPDEWERLIAAYGSTSEAYRGFTRLLAAQIDERGVLDVLRHGVKDRGVAIALAYFRPSHTLAHRALDNYRANRLTVVRQLHYSARDPQKSLDLALFVNGIPVATAELKNPLTGQTVEDAKQQYRSDRDPKELLFARRTLVHFAVDPDLAFITTRQPATRPGSCRSTRARPAQAVPAAPATRLPSTTRPPPAALPPSAGTGPPTSGSRSGSGTRGSTCCTGSCTWRATAPRRAGRR